MSRLHRITCLTYVLAPLLGICQLSTAYGASWSLVVLPDTQHYVDDSDNVDGFVTQTTWIVDNIDTYDISFVTHVGDVVQHGDSDREWDRADSAMDILHGEVPYGVCIGDHDYEDEESRSSGANEYLARYGASRYEEFSWYGGSSPDGKSHFQVFDGGGRSFLHINLEWEASGSVYSPETTLGWARATLDDHADVPAIITTHSYVWDKPGQEGRTNGVEENSSDGSSGEMLWSELVANNPQVFMVLGGNFHKAKSKYDPDDPSDDSWDGEYHQVSSNLLGLPVYEMLSNYQDYPNGGDGWLRLVQFQEGGGSGGLDRISVQTYSPTLDAYQTDPRSEFHFDLSFADRFDRIPAQRPTHRVVFGRGHDAFIWKKNPSSNYGNETRTKMDTSYGGTSSNPMPRQGLLRFFIKLGSDGIPDGAEIVRAELRARQTDSGDGFHMHRMLVPWSESTVTWDSLDDGVDTDGSEALATADFSSLEYMTEGESAAYSIFDVTSSVQAWVDGEANHGWVLVPTGTDQFNLESFEGGTYGPELVVDYVMPNAERVVVTSGEDAFVWEQNPATQYGTSGRIKVDSSDGTSPQGEPYPMQGLIRFDLVTGNGRARYPRAARSSAPSFACISPTPATVSLCIA